ncbi:techylectin-5A-like [Stegodyphus dumicola]|uniref:techylectin-5A-like n=1 Tax=Stegodyphus dumicola TaxID=202533 RepID=UPI0015AE6288|nr:techylectin-5A-like [Stegodyphus dumicola]
MPEFLTVVAPFGARGLCNAVCVPADEDMALLHGCAECCWLTLHDLLYIVVFLINLCTDSDLSLNKPMDCAEIKMKNKTLKSGIYNIWPVNKIIKTSVNVYCDMEDDNGGWTVIQRRGDFDSAKDYFYRDWVSYKNGFGDLTKDFWLGNDNTFALTNERSNQIKITLTDWEGNTTYAIYDEFWIDNEYHNYTAHVMGYRGTSGDSFSYVNGVPFSTKDKDNDILEGSCAVTYKGGWWYRKCHASNLNGFYLKGPHESPSNGIEWKEFRGLYYSLKDTVMKIRSIDYQTTEKGQTDITP